MDPVTLAFWTVFFKVLSSFSLLLGVASAVMLWKFGLPSDVRRTGARYIMLEQTSQADIDKGVRYDRNAHVALRLLVASFLFQFAASIFAFWT